MMYLRSRLSHCLLTVAACAVALASQIAHAATVVNPVSAFLIDVDGVFSNGVSSGVINGEWSDVAPLAFISPPVTNPALPFGGLQATTVGDPNANALLYAAIAPGSVPADPIEDLYLMYVNATRTNPVFTAGEEMASVVFPVTFNGGPHDLRVRLVSSLTGAHEIVADPEGDGTETGIGGFFDVFLDIDGSPAPPTAADQLGIEAAVGFGPSPLTALSHMLIELEVALTIPAGRGDGDPFSPGGVGDPNNGYSPEPAFWGAEAKNNTIDPPISAAIFTIDPATGITTATSDFLLPQQIEVPEPVTAVLLGLGLVGLAGARRLRSLKKR